MYILATWQRILKYLVYFGKKTNTGHTIGASHSDRKNAWRGMIASGATTTKEAWDSTEKPVSMKTFFAASLMSNQLLCEENLTWSHPWGASPAWVIPAYMLGITATSPAFATMCIRSQLGTLTEAAGKLPTIRGPIVVSAR